MSVGHFARWPPWKSTIMDISNPKWHRILILVSNLIFSWPKNLTNYFLAWLTHLFSPAYHINPKWLPPIAMNVKIRNSNLWNTMILVLIFKVVNYSIYIHILEHILLLKFYAAYMTLTQVQNLHVIICIKSTSINYDTLNPRPAIMLLFCLTHYNEWL